MLAALIPVSSAHAAATWSACPDPGFGAFACTTVSVPLDRGGGVAGTVSLFARRLTPQPGGAPSRVAVVALSGGPGQSAASSAADFAVALAPALRSRDLLVFDQRGTGQSGPLDCPSLSQGGSATEVVGACAAALGPRRAFYRTADSVADLEALRAEAGYDKLVLFGVSYGTKVALDYASRHPDRVESIVLDSVVPQEGPDPLVRSSIVAVRRLLRELCGAGRCRRATRDPVADLRRLVARERVRGVLVDSRGRRRRAAVAPSALFAVLQAGDLNPASRAQLPGAMRAAVRGDGAALLRVTVDALGGTDPDELGSRLQVRERGSNIALYLATICEEVQFPWQREAGLRTRLGQADAALRALPSSEITPFDTETVAGAGLLPLCIGWPNATPAPEAPAALPDVPALLLSGSADVRTPTENIPAVAARLPQARPVTVPFVGHSVLGGDPSGCARAALAGFFNGAGVTPCPNRGPLVRPGAQPPRALGALRPSGGVGGRAGRTLTAVLRTRDDSLLEALSLGFASRARGGGLRGGTISLTQRGVVLRNVQVVEGVRVSGTFPDAGGRARLRVSGPAAARGTVSLTTSGGATGTLGGRRVRVASGAAAGPSWDIPAEVRRLRPLDLRP